MVRHLRNVTLTLEEDVARWARIRAAEGAVSMSRLLSEMLRERMREDEGYGKAMERSLERKPFLESTADAQERPRLRG
jgi:hypothetical protein